MGRLTDHILALTGHRPIDRMSKVDQGADGNMPNTTAGPGAESSKDISVKIRNDTQADVQDQDISPTIELIGAPGKNSFGTEDRLKDCFGCKLVGVGVGVGVSGGCAYIAYKNHTKFRGMQKVMYFTQVFLLSSGMLALGLARFFDASVFNPSRPKMTPQEHLAEDTRNFLKFVGIKPPGILDRNNESDSTS